MDWDGACTEQKIGPVSLEKKNNIKVTTLSLWPWAWTGVRMVLYKTVD